MREGEGVDGRERGEGSGRGKKREGEGGRGKWGKVQGEHERRDAFTTQVNMQKFIAFIIRHCTALSSLVSMF